MKNHKFQPGDFVQLKSGGPKLTVDSYCFGNNINYCCIWFDGFKFIKEIFSEEAIQKYPENT